MAKHKFRTFTPIRTYSGREYADHYRYREPIEKDFNNRCGYSNISDKWLGKSAFQLDHFAPKSKFPHLSSKYSNMVYSCRFVNRAKWDKWPSDDANKNEVAGKGFLDPCDVDYNLHFYRDSMGRIHPEKESDIANYMYRTLRLYLKRYSIGWLIESIDEKMIELSDLQEEGKLHKEGMGVFFELFREFQKHIKLLAESY